jgi:hypothetical protein
MQRWLERWRAYGARAGENIRYASRIIFSNGKLDPWHGGGFLESLSDSLIAIIIKVRNTHSMPSQKLT